MFAEKAQELVGADGAPENPAGKQQGIAFHADPVDRGAGQGGGVDVRALEPFVPIALVVNDSALEIFPPQRRAAINTQPVESERVQLEPGAETEAFEDVLEGFAGRANQEIGRASW